MSKKNGLGHVLAGAAIGAGLGVLFAPKKGSETRKELKEKTKELANQVKNIDVEEVRNDFDTKINEIRMELVDLDKEKALDIAKEKANVLKKKAQELYDLAMEKGTPIVKKTAKELLENVIKVSRDTIKRLDNNDKTKNKNK